MPTSLVKNLSKKSNRPVQVVEKMWDDIVEQQSKKMKENDPKFYSIVVATLKKKLNIKEEETKEDDKTTDTTKVGGTRSITDKPIGENFTNGLATANLDYTSPTPGNGAHFDRALRIQKRKKKAKKKKVKIVESGNYLLSSSVGSLEEEKKKVKPLTEMDKWTKTWGQFYL